MIKKSIAFAMVITIALGSLTTVKAQEKKSYTMWESITITPDNTKLKALGEAMKKHNQTYHKAGPYKAYVYNIVSGPNANKIVWEMGPVRFSDFDKRPSTGGHDEDWRDQVMPNVKSLNTVEYWRKDDKLSNEGALDPNKVSHPILYIRYLEVADGQGYNINRLLKQVSETIKAMDGENPWGVYYNEGRQGSKIGRHIATVSFLKNWEEMDEDGKFKETFVKIHGKNSWDPFIKGFSQTFVNSWDEIWKFNPELSGHK